MVVSVRSRRFFAQHPVGNRLGAFFLQQCLGANGNFALRGRGFGQFYTRCGASAPLSFRMAIDSNVGDIGQHLGAPVTTTAKVEQLGRLIDELGGVFIAKEGRVLQQVLDKGDIGTDAANAEFAQGPVHPGNCGARGLGRGR